MGGAILNPFVYELRDALVESGIATGVQGERFIEVCQRIGDELEEGLNSARAARAREFDSWPWYKRLIRDRYRYISGA